MSYFLLLRQQIGPQGPFKNFQTYTKDIGAPNSVYLPM